MNTSIWFLIAALLYILVLVLVMWLTRSRQLHTIKDFFIGGGNLPWGILGISMVATTFAADTPLAVAGIVVKDGIAGNWIWWGFLPSSILTIFIFSRLWKRCGALTDVEFIKLRYDGTSSKILRGCRAIYLSIGINGIVMGWVTLGMTTLLKTVFDTDPWLIIGFCYLFITLYIMITGFWGVVITDNIQFFIAFLGSIWFALIALDYSGGWQELSTNIMASKPHLLSFNPFNHPTLSIGSVLAWLGIIWWASWYPGVEPGGGGYITQRIFASKNERHAQKATFLFTLLHYAIRPWPWIIVGLVAVVSISPEHLTQEPELAYPLLMKLVLSPPALAFLTVTFVAAFISTISTHINLAASYLINDVYRPFIRPSDSFTSKQIANSHYLKASRIATLLCMAIAILISTFMDSIKDGWEILMAFGGGTGLVFMLRWFWWRINAWSEISAMLSAAFYYIFGIDDWMLNVIGISQPDTGTKIICITILVTITWISITFLTKPISHTKKLAFSHLMKKD